MYLKNFVETLPTLFISIPSLTDYLPNSVLVVPTLGYWLFSSGEDRLTQRQNLFSSRPSDTGIAADVSQDVNIVDVGGHMRSPFDTAVSRKLVGGSPNDASFVASKWIGDHVGDLTTRPFLESVFDGVLRIKAFSFASVALQACQFNTVDVTLEKVAFQWIC